jgi:hypothetical protein
LEKLSIFTQDVIASVIASRGIRRVSTDPVLLVGFDVRLTTMETEIQALQTLVDSTVNPPIIV